MSAVKLKPCPFCGGKAVVARSDDEPPVFFAGCDTLWCRGSAVTLSHYRSPEEAAEAWNRRAPGSSRLEGLDSLEHLETLDPTVAPGDEA
ncbi:MAG: Lar family restriction alleviation protein [Kiritimatiellae bacterium]|nr:Lar family restriction alleviation protein [Kiritimatiellia bacterium]